MGKMVDENGEQEVYDAFDVPTYPPRNKQLHKQVPVGEVPLFAGSLYPYGSLTSWRRLHESRRYSCDSSDRS